MSWKTELRAHFAARQELSPEELAKEFGVMWPDGRDALEDCLRLFLEEYGIPVGLLRQDDDLRLFLHAPTTGNPVGAAFRDAAMQDKASELNYRLKKRRRAFNAPLAHPPMTIGQYVAAWLGQEAKSGQ